MTVLWFVSIHPEAYIYVVSIDIDTEANILYATFAKGQTTSVYAYVVSYHQGVQPVCIQKKEGGD
jgi:hypothetical protein